MPSSQLLGRNDGRREGTRERPARRTSFCQNCSPESRETSPRPCRTLTALHRLIQLSPLRLDATPSPGPRRDCPL